MGREPSPLDHLQTAFDLLVTQPHPLAIDGRRVGNGLPQRLVPLDELRRWLLNRHTGLAARDEIWRHIAVKARDGRSAWVVGAAGIALPGLRAVAGRIAWNFRGDTTDLDAELLAAFLHALHTADLDRPAILQRLLWAALRGGTKARNAAGGIAPRPGPYTVSAEPPAPWGHPDFILTDAVDKGVLTLTEARVIGCTRLEDLTLAQAGDLLGMSYQAVKKLRYRAECRLVRALARGDVAVATPHEDTHDPLRNGIAA